MMRGPRVRQVYECRNRDTYISLKVNFKCVFCTAGCYLSEGFEALLESFWRYKSSARDLVPQIAKLDCMGGPKRTLTSYRQPTELASTN